MSLWPIPSVTANATGASARCLATEASMISSPGSTNDVELHLAHQRRYARGDTVILGKRFAQDGAIRRETVRPKIGVVVAAPHLYHGDHLLDVARDLHIPLHDDVVGD